jgi:deazaflavin-dependent oxidoreductase (nitroreductase family)
MDPVTMVRAELANSPIVDITTTGRRSGQPRRIEIWMLDVDGRFFITGTPGRRGWLANLAAAPGLVVHLKRHARTDLAARATVITDPELRRHVLTHANAAWYRGRAKLEELIAGSPMVEVAFWRTPLVTDQPVVPRADVWT